MLGFNNLISESRPTTSTTSDYMLNIIQNINLLYQMLQPHQDQTTASMSQVPFLTNFFVNIIYSGYATARFSVSTF